MKQMPDRFHLIWPEPECVNVCFWYVPKRLRGIPHSMEREQELGRVSVVCFFIELISLNRLLYGKYLKIAEANN